MTHTSTYSDTAMYACVCLQRCSSVEDRKNWVQVISLQQERSAIQNASKVRYHLHSPALLSPTHHAHANQTPKRKPMLTPLALTLLTLPRAHPYSKTCLSSLGFIFTPHQAHASNGENGAEPAGSRNLHRSYEDQHSAGTPSTSDHRLSASMTDTFLHIMDGNGKETKEAGSVPQGRDTASRLQVPPARD
eukprot:1026021-Pyramimonas_sp.AAC.1